MKMEYRRLYIWVEGDDDYRFFDKLVKPLFEEKYDSIELIKYKERKGMNKKKVNNFLKSITAMNTDYIFVGDINAHPCATAKKQELRHTYRNIDERRIVVIKKEIESWYLAGLTRENSKNLGVHYFNNTDTIAKEQFDVFIPTKFDSRIDFMTEVLKVFSIETAKEKNESFKYFIEKYCTHKLE